MSETDPLGLCWPDSVCHSVRAVRREASTIRDWGVASAKGGWSAAGDLATGRTGRALGDEMYDADVRAGGGIKGKFMAASTFAYRVTQPIYDCGDGLAHGGGAAANFSNCGQAAAFVVGPKLGRLVRCEAEVADGVGALRRLEFEPSPRHGLRDRGRVSRGPTNGQAALDHSLQVRSTSPRRVGIDYDSGEFVVFNRTLGNTYHGHVRPWQELERPMQKALRDAGMADRRGRIREGNS